MQNPTSGYVTNMIACLGSLGLTLANLPRIRRKRQVNDRQTDEDYPPKWVLGRRARLIPSDRIQEPHGLREGADWGLPPV